MNSSPQQMPTLEPTTPLRKPHQSVATSWMQSMRRLVRSREAFRGGVCLADQAVVSATNFVTTAMIGRMCVEAELGIYAAGLSLTMLVLMSVPRASIWLPYTTLSPRYSERRLKLYLGSVTVHTLIICLCISAVLALVHVTGIMQLAGSGLASLFGVLSLTASFIFLRQFVRRTLLAHRLASPLLLLDVLFAIIHVGTLALLGSYGLLSASRAFLTMGATSLLIVFITAVGARKSIRFRTRAVLLDLKKNWKIGRWTLPTFFVSALNDGLYVWLIAFVHGAASAGTYAAAASIVALLNPVMIGFGNFYNPYAAHTFATKGSVKFTRLMTITTLALAALLAIFVVGLCIVGDEIIQLVYEGRFAGQGALIGTMAIAYALQTLAIPVSFGLIAIDRANFALRARSIQLAVGLVLGTALTLQFGALGAAIASSAGALCNFTIQWVYFMRNKPDA